MFLDPDWSQDYSFDMLVSDLVAAMEQIAPTRLAETWDNVGLLAGDPAQPLTKVLLTIDYTPEVAAEAVAAGCDAVIAYHPPIFRELKRVLAGSVVHDAIKNGIALYSPHTALDVAEGGTNDLLADALGLVDRSPLRSSTGKATHYKLIVFVPEKDADEVAAALFDAGAGRIGDYTSCSFRSPGTGTFLGQEGTKPSAGSAGKLERVPELRIETVLPVSRLEPVLRALRETHPYEEPAFDLVQLAAPPEGMGMGRIGELPEAAFAGELADRVKEALGLSHLLIASGGERPLKKVAVCAGAGGEMLGDALAQHADLYLTGEIRHHDALRAAKAGMTVFCTLHSNSERGVLPRLAARLGKMLSGVEIVVSRKDRDPFQIM